MAAVRDPAGARRSASTPPARWPASCAPRWSGALRENYVTGAEMRGFSRRRVLFGHVLRNASGPALAVLGLAVPTIIGGAVITEKLFNLPGIAQLALQSARAGRRPGHPRHAAGHRRRRADRQHGRQRRADRPQPGRPSGRARRGRHLDEHAAPDLGASRRPASRSSSCSASRSWSVAGGALAPHDPLAQDPTHDAPGAGRRALARHRLPRPRRAQPADGRHPASRSPARSRRSLVARCCSGILPGLASAWLGPRLRVVRAAGHRHPDGAAVHGLRDRGRRHPRQRPAPVDGRDRRADVAAVLPGHPRGRRSACASRSTSRRPS